MDALLKNRFCMKKADRKGTQEIGLFPKRIRSTGKFTLIELLVNTSQHNCFSLLLKSPQLP